MAAYLDVLGMVPNRLILDDGQRVAIGRSSSNDLALVSDGRVSRLHAIVERFPAGWCVRDMGSSNGTFVNGVRIWDERLLAPGDEILVGQTVIVFSPGEPVDREELTSAGSGIPHLTTREREVLVALCRPGVSGEVFVEPASVREISQRLFITDAAVKQHLAKLYRKLEIDPSDERRRVRLANEALRRGLIRMQDVRETAGPRAADR